MTLPRDTSRQQQTRSLPYRFLCRLQNWTETREKLQLHEISELRCYCSSNAAWTLWMVSLTAQRGCLCQTKDHERPFVINAAHGYDWGIIWGYAHGGHGGVVQAVTADVGQLNRVPHDQADLEKSGGVTFTNLTHWEVAKVSAKSYRWRCANSLRVPELTGP